MADDEKSRDKLKRLLKDFDSGKKKSVGKRAKEAVSGFVAQQRERRTPQFKTEQARLRSETAIKNQEVEAALKSARESELEEVRKAKTAKEERRQAERVLFQEKYGKQIEQAKGASRTIGKGITEFGKGLGEVGKLALGTETISEAQQRVGKSIEVGKKRGFVAEPLRQLSRERQAVIKQRRQEDIGSYLESEGLTRRDVREAQQRKDLFNFPEIDVGF